MKHADNLARLLRKVRRELVFPAYCHRSHRLRSEDRDWLAGKVELWARCSEVDLGMLVNRIRANRPDLILAELDFWIAQAERPQETA